MNLMIDTMPRMQSAANQSTDVVKASDAAREWIVGGKRVDFR